MARDDRRALALLACTFTLLYAYFFQGGGWNQNSHLDTIRALVERHTLDITPYADNTGDVGVVDGRTYSNKPPGLALWCAPFYFVVHGAERALAIPPEAPWTITANAHLLTFWGSGLPAVALLVVLYLWFRRAGASAAQALCLSGAFGAGSLLLPYSGLLMSHCLSACLLFSAWYLLETAPGSSTRAMAAGLAAGAALVTELLAGPAIALFALYLLAKRRRRAAALFLAGPVAMAGLLRALPHVILASRFTSAGLLFGVFDWPQPIRLYWLTLHPFRGLLYCCPMFFVCLLSLRRPAGAWPIASAAWVRAAVVAYFVLFNLCFNGWTGGWAIGPRYLVPALPFLWTFALRGALRFPRVSTLLVAASAAIMLCVTLIEVTIPGPDTGPPPPADPVRFAARQMLAGRVSIWSESLTGPSGRDPSPHREWDSYNLGELAGLRGAWSALPPTLLLAGFAFAALRSASSRLPGSPTPSAPT